MHHLVAAQMESKWHLRLTSPWLFMACSGFRKHCTTNVAEILAVSVTSGAIVLVCEGLQSICLTQGQHRNGAKICSGFGVFFKL